MTKKESKSVLMQGNEAIARGALAAGVNFFAGYPITPSTEIAEICAVEMPKMGRKFIQMEDEISSMAAIVGASLAGAKSMTATSGPGFSLMQEGMGYAKMVEAPCIVVNVMRGGPSTGSPTKPSQADIMQARWGNHGDAPSITLYPNSVMESYELAIRAVNLAEKYRTCVTLLSDEVLGHMRERIEIPDLKTIKVVNRVKPTIPPEWYKHYPENPKYPMPLASFGEGYRFHVTGLAHDAKGYPTKMYWAWSDAGKLDSGKMLHYEKEIPKDSILAYTGNADYMHNITSDSVIYEYDSRHAAAILAKNVIPDYMWYNGYVDHHFLEDPITSDTVELNKLMGSYEDNLHPMDSKHPSRIYPVKTMRGNQVYDTEYHKLINPKLVGAKGSGGYWQDFDWDSSATKGMEYLGYKYSGHYGFVNTKSYWPINHEVVPANQALSCESCHRPNGRLENLSGFYLPGRDRNPLIEWFGIFAIIGALLGVSIHGILRILVSKKNKI